jgi:hypothetical protein
VFAAVERRVAHPLLPLRIVADRNRAAADIAILVAGIGMFGVFFGPSSHTATYRANPADAGGASEMVNTGQQLGAAIGVSLLNTVTASAAGGYVARAALSQLAQTSATVPGDDMACLVTAALFAAGAVAAGTIFRQGRLGADGLALTTLDASTRQPPGQRA